VMGAMSQDRVLRIDTLDHSIKGDDFRHFIQMQLVPQLWKGAMVVKSACSQGGWDSRDD
jgi:hypothetical protein